MSKFRSCFSVIIILLATAGILVLFAVNPLGAAVLLVVGLPIFMVGIIAVMLFSNVLTSHRVSVLEAEAKVFKEKAKVKEKKKKKKATT